MQIWPAIDLRGGKCVRLQQVDYDRETVFGADPREMALRWIEAGGQRLHLGDLDGARDGQGANRDAVEAVTSWEPGLSEGLRVLLCDAQTSGGLLAFVPRHEASELAAEWESAGYAAAVVGHVEDPADKPTLTVEEG